MKVARSLAAAVVIGAALSSITLGEAGAANASTAEAAAVLCVGASCNGRDPVDMGCNNDAQTVATVNTSDGTVNLRRSNACKANWAQVTNVPIWGIHFWVENQAGNKQEYGWGWFGAASGWSNMVNGQNILSRACDDHGCTGWR